MREPSTRPSSALLRALAVMVLAAPLLAGVDQERGRRNQPKDRPNDDTATEQKAPEVTELTVRVAGDGKPVSGAVVTVAAAGKKNKETTSASGSARFRDLPQGRASVSVTAAGWEPSGGETVELSGATKEIVVKLAGLSTDLAVRVVDAASGEPVAGCEVRVAVADGRPRDAKTRSDGRAELKGLSRGEATIKVVPNGFDPASKVVDLQRSKQSVEIKVTRRSPPP